MRENGVVVLKFNLTRMETLSKVSHGLLVVKEIVYGGLTKTLILQNKLFVMKLILMTNVPSFKVILVMSHGPLVNSVSVFIQTQSQKEKPVNEPMSGIVLNVTNGTVDSLNTLMRDENQITA